MLAAMLAAQDAVAPTPPAAAAVVAWRYAPVPSDFHEVLVHGGKVFALDRTGRIHAIDAVTGEKIWISDGGLQFRQVFGMSIADRPEIQAVLVGCDQGLLLLRASDGVRLWYQQIQGGVAGPALIADIVVAAGANGRVYGCALATGEVRWQHDYLEDRPDDPPGFRGRNARFANPARPGDADTDGTLVAVSIFDQCRTLALDAHGRRLWEFRTEGWIYGRPTIGPLYVYVGSQDQRMYAIDKQIGKPAWQLETAARNEAAAAVHGRFVYYGSCNGNLYALDAAVGGSRGRSRSHPRATVARPSTAGRW